MQYTKERFQELANLSNLKESSYHLAQNDFISDLAAEHTITIMKKLEIPREDANVVYDDLYHTLKQKMLSYISTR